MPTAADAAAGYTDLMVACRDGAAEDIRAQLATGADVGAINSKESTSLIVASAGGHTNAVALLLEAGATVDTRNRAGLTALMAASAGGRTATVAALLAAGADANAVALRLELKTRTATVAALIAACADANAVSAACVPSRLALARPWRSTVPCASLCTVTV